MANIQPLISDFFGQAKRQASAFNKFKIASDPVDTCFMLLRKERSLDYHKYYFRNQPRIDC